jgi:hypothetical protein
MNDPIKKYVEQHREAFDHMEPPSAVFEQLQERLKAANIIVEKKNVPLFSRVKWIAAASVLMALTAGLYLYTDNKSEGLDKVVVQTSSNHPDKEVANHTEPKEEGTIVIPRLSNSGQVTIDQADQKDHLNPVQGQILAKQSVKQRLKKNRQEQIATKLLRPGLEIDRDTKDLYARLGDSSSSSIWLSAILDI